MTRPVPRRIRRQVIADQRVDGRLFCGYCSRPLSERPGSKSIHIDHVIPRVSAESFPYLFAADELEESWNLLAVCRCCNEGKQARRGGSLGAAWPPEECEFWLDYTPSWEKLYEADKRWFRRWAAWVTTATGADLEYLEALCLRAGVGARLTRAIVESAAAAGEAWP